MKLFFNALFLSGMVTSALLSLETPTFLVEHARTDSQISWGLMQRRSLAENRGMLFHYNKSQQVNFWSFNCYIDLSVAFIDEKKVIREIRTLNAFPEKMDPARPVFSLEDLNLYSRLDPVLVFFQERSVSSSIPVKYVLEMNLGWFEKNQVKVGDILHWSDLDNTAHFSKPEGNGPIQENLSMKM